MKKYRITVHDGVDTEFEHEFYLMAENELEANRDAAVSSRSLTEFSYFGIEEVALFDKGDRVLYSGGWNKDAPRQGTVTGSGIKNGEIVIDVKLDDGAWHWGYQNQFQKEV